MEESQFLAEQQLKITRKMIEINKVLLKKELTESDHISLGNLIDQIRHYAAGKNKGMDEEISSIVKVVALRMSEESIPGIETTEATTFGNGAHVIVPGKYIGKKIRYTVLDRTSMEE